MRHIKSYNQHNESIKSNIAKLGLMGTLMLPTQIKAEPQNNVDKIEWTQIEKSDGTQVAKDVSRISNLRLKEKQKDAKLSDILDRIQESLESRDSTKYQQLFDELSDHIQEKYNYKIKERSIEEVSQSGGIKSNMSLFEILGWLGSLCLAICAIPQAWMSFRDKHSEGISWSFLLLWAFGELFALVYVYDKLDLPLLLNYATNILVLGVILYYKIKPQTKDSIE